MFGDPGARNKSHCSWIEALGAWRRATILFTKPLPNGKIEGTTAAYVALCEKFKVPLLGLLQVDGNWEDKERRVDGLPWCGWLPGKENSLIEESDDFPEMYCCPDFIIQLLQIKLKSFNS